MRVPALPPARQHPLAHAHHARGLRFACVSLVLAGSLMHAAAATAAPAKATPFKHPKGYYTIELPEGFKLKAMNDDGAMFENKSGMGWFRLDILPVRNTLDLVSTIPLTTIKKVMPDATPAGEPQDFEVNGVPARWMAYRGTITAKGQSLPFVGLGGALSFPSMGISLMSALSADEYPKSGEAIAAAFRTIRAGDATPPQPVVASNDSPTTFTHEVGSLDLPAGWSGKPSTDAPCFAEFSGPGGASLVFFRLPKLQVNKEGVAVVGENTLLKIAPQFKRMPPGAYPLTPQGGARLTAARYQGPMPVEGRDVDGRGYVAFGKHGKVNLLCVGYVVGEKAADAQDQMEAIVRTLR